jgi:hypothetical protein
MQDSTFVLQSAFRGGIMSRISIYVTAKEHKFIKTLCALQGKAINEHNHQEMLRLALLEGENSGVSSRSVQHIISYLAQA